MPAKTMRYKTIIRWKQASRSARRLIAAAAFLAFALGAASLWTTGHAADFVQSAEAEAGAPGGAAVPVDSSLASGATAVTFGSVSSGEYSCDQAGIQKLVNSVSAANVEANLRSLVQDDTKATPNMTVSRHVSQPGNKQKTDWMKQKLAGYGLTDRSQSFSADGASLVNPVGRINGAQPTNLYAVGGHIDSIASNSGSSNAVAPGADEDGSGVAATIEAARVLYGFRSCLKSSVDFIGFNDEEESMKGSSTYVGKIDKTFKGLFNMDMIATHQNGTDCVENAYNSSRDKFMADKLHEVNTKYGIGMKSSVITYNSDDVDSWNFWNKSQPSSYSAECKFSPNYHSTKDVIDASISFTQITKMTKMIVGSVAELGMQ